MTIEPQIPAKWLTIASYVLPAIVLIGSVLLSIMPVHVIGYKNILPPFVYAVVYYWSVFRQRTYPASLAFLTGLSIDLLIGSAAVGVNAFVLVAMRWLLVAQSRFLSGQQFIAHWLVYTIVTLLGQIAVWMLYSLLMRDVLPLVPVVIGSFFATALFPLFYGVLHNVHRVIEMARETP